MALNRKIAYIDLSTGEVKTAPIPIEVRKLYLGGRGLDMYLLYNHLEPGVDPLGWPRPRPGCTLGPGRR
jgi:aldehyde:ferredoxin oxidoreductase